MGTGSEARPRLLSTTVGAVNSADISRLSDAELHRRAKELAAAERGATADLIEHLAEIDRRRIYRGSECNSLFEYCVHMLACSEAAAYRRIRATRACQIFPPISALLREGKLTLESVALLHPFLEGPDAAVLVMKASGMKTWQVQELLAKRQAPGTRRDVVRFCAPPVARSPTPDRESAPLLAVMREADEKAFAALIPPPPAQTEAPVAVSNALPCVSRSRPITSSTRSCYAPERCSVINTRMGGWKGSSRTR